jgi:hypothetical protein
MLADIADEPDEPCKDDRSMKEMAVITGLTETKAFRIRKKLFVLIKTMEEGK